MSAPNIKLAFALAQAATAAMRREKQAMPGAGLFAGLGKGLMSAGRIAKKPAVGLGAAGLGYGGYRAVQTPIENPYQLPKPQDPNTPGWQPRDQTADLLGALKANQQVVHQTVAPAQDAYTNALLGQKWDEADRIQQAMAAGKYNMTPGRNGQMDFSAPSGGGSFFRSVGHSLFPSLVAPAAPSFQDAQKNVTGLMSQAAKHYQQLGGTQASAPARITQAMTMLQQRINSGMAPPQQLAAMQAQLAQLEQLRSTLVATPETSQMQELGRMLQAGGYGQPTPPPMQPIPQQTPPAPLRWGAP